jgi:hypothetical protein
MELKNLEAEGFLQPGSWRTVPNSLAPAPEDNEMVLTKALVERGFSFPPSDFFSEILMVYGLQPHNISPNSVLAISNHVTLCGAISGYLPNSPSSNIISPSRRKRSARPPSWRHAGPLPSCFALAASTLLPTATNSRGIGQWVSSI